MREVKFRCWDPVKKVMCAENTLAAFALAGVSDYEAALEQWQHLIPMQFTGLKDRNGKDIYDGDIIDHNNETFRVDWDAEGACFMAVGISERTNPNDGESYRIADTLLMNVAYVSEVIGNVHQNPELLKSDDNG